MTCEERLGRRAVWPRPRLAVGADVLGAKMDAVFKASSLAIERSLHCKQRPMQGPWTLFAYRTKHIHRHT
jgi:hypothetical protein